jgi:hypothetical protein
MTQDPVQFTLQLLEVCKYSKSASDYQLEGPGCMVMMLLQQLAMGGAEKTGLKLLTRPGSRCFLMIRVRVEIPAFRYKTARSQNILVCSLMPYPTKEENMICAEN